MSRASRSPSAAGRGWRRGPPGCWPRTSRSPTTTSSTPGSIARPTPTKADFRLQAERAALWFDLDAPEADGLRVEAKRLVAESKPLDYALLELASPADRPVPRLAPSIVELDSTSRMAVNIVQHPRGEPKRVAFRNNLVTAADATTIRYFADTDQGSSGSPVCDDKWRWSRSTAVPAT